MEIDSATVQKSRLIQATRFGFGHSRQQSHPVTSNDCDFLRFSRLVTSEIIVQPNFASTGGAFQLVNSELLGSTESEQLTLT